MNKFKQHLFALFTMVMGTVLVMGLVYSMNESTTAPPKADQKDAVAFKVDRKPPPKKVRKRTPRKKRVKRAARSAAATPSLTSNLGGPSFDLPQFAGTDLTSGGSKLLKSKGGNQVFTADTVDERPRALHQIPPDVPETARAKALTGFVKVRFQISSEGQVQKTRVIDSQPTGLFDGSVVAALSQWEYEPARYQGAPVKVSVTKTFRFN